MEENREFIEKFRAGDDYILREIISSYQKRIFNIVLGIVTHREDSEDLTQRIFLKAFKNRKNFQGRSTFYTWIYRIAINEAMDMLKSRKKKFAYQEEVLPMSEIMSKENSLSVELEKKQLKAFVDTAMQKMDLKYRTILVLKDIQGFSYKEIAEMMDISMDKVKIWLFRARKSLKEIIEKDGGGFCDV